MICLENVTKEYRLKETRGGLLHRLIEPWKRARHCVLRDISVEIPDHQSVALIGANGCGKSTLLRLISGVAQPTSGRVQIGGRVSGVVDIGEGFHWDLTGMENVFLNATVLGMTRAQILSRLDSILAFAELDHFIYTPVRHYSWGMLLRLSFAIAVHTDSDIFIVDEALAVGDGYFQWKCLQKIREIKAAGNTLLFVSHMPTLSESVCERALWIHEAQIREDGPTSKVVAAYNRFVHHGAESEQKHFSREVLGLVPQSARMGTGHAIIHSLQMSGEDAHPRHAFQTGEPVRLELQIECVRPVRDASLGLVLELPDQPVWMMASVDHGVIYDLDPGQYVLRVEFPSLQLHAGNYYLSVSVISSSDLANPIVYDLRSKMHNFTVIEAPPPFGYSARIAEMPATFSVENSGPG